MLLESASQPSDLHDRCCRCLDLGSEGVVVVSADGSIRCANAAAGELTGVPVRAMMDAPVDLLVDSDRRDELRSLIAIVATTGGGARDFFFTAQRKTAAPRRIRVRVRAAKVAFDGDCSACLVLTDITELRLAEELTSFQAYVLDQVGQAIVATDVDGRVSYWNRTAELLYGYPADDAIGRPVAELMTDFQGHEFTSLSAGESAWSKKIDARRRDGSTVPVFVTVTSLDAATSFSGLLIVSHDVTEQRQLESRLRCSECLEGIGRLAGGVAHDFNNLLTIILNYAADIEATAEGDVRAKAKSIVAAGESAARMSRQLLAFARREPARRGPLDLNVVIAEAMRLFERAVGDDVRLVWTETEIPLVTADRSQVERVLLNLTVNARDAMSAGGTLTIETEVVDLDEAFVRCHPEAQPGRYVRLSVTDTGTGMPGEVAARAFEPFFTTKGSQGTGLGLSTVHGAVVDSGGAVDLYSELGFGTTVRVYLPVAALDSIVTPPGQEVAAGSPPRCDRVVLVADDQTAVREVVAEILRSEGYTVYEASDAEGALRLSNDAHVDLLLSDVVMAGAQGPDLARAVLDRDPNVAVLYMSGCRDGALARGSDRGPGAGLLVKPFTGAALLAAVASALVATEATAEGSR